MHYIYSIYICIIIWYLFFYFWLILLCITGSRFIHHSSTDSILSLFIAEYYSIESMCHNFFIYLTVSGHLGCFHVLAIVNSAAMNFGVHVTFSIRFSQDVCPVVGLLGHNSSTLATSCEELTHWKRLWCWEGLGAGGEGDARGWDGWMASLTWWRWVSVNSGSWWWTGKPGVLRFMGVAKSRTRLSDWSDLIPSF